MEMDLSVRGWEIHHARQGAERYMYPVSLQKREARNAMGSSDFSDSQLFSKEAKNTIKRFNGFHSPALFFFLFDIFDKKSYKAPEYCVYCG